ncbi:MAG TPA: hypothetical protein VII31_07900 [Caldimonas sp.]
MIQMYPKAVVLTNRHPFGGTEMMAQSLASALDANGYDSHIVSINDATFQNLSALLKDPQLALVMTTGTLPLQIAVDGVPIWRALAPGVQFIAYIIDAWPYDAVRVEPCRAFLADWPHTPHLHLASLEANDARLIGARAHYMPSGAYPAPRRSGAKLNGGRLLIWASANKELAVTPVHDEFEQTIAANNVWALDERRIARAGEALRHTEVVHGLGAIAAALEQPLEEVVQPGALVALCAIDSCLKRYRRVKVVKALKGLPVDIYGENWQQHVGKAPSFRLLTPSPNHNHAFSHLCQHYAGLVNFDPNFGHGTNERAVSALALGTPIANNFNARTDGLVGCIPYHFEDASIRNAAEQLLGYRGAVPLQASHTWEYLVGRLLGEIAAEAAAAGDRPPVAGEKGIAIRPTPALQHA